MEIFGTKTLDKQVLDNFEKLGSNFILQLSDQVICLKFFPKIGTECCRSQFRRHIVLSNKFPDALKPVRAKNVGQHFVQDFNIVTCFYLIGTRKQRRGSTLSAGSIENEQKVSFF